MTRDLDVVVVQQLTPRQVRSRTNEDLQRSTVCPVNFITNETSLNTVRASWDALGQFTTLDSLCDDLQSKTPSVSRSACWKACLLFRDLDTTKWDSISKTSREKFSSLQSKYLRNINNPDEVDSFDDPLSEDSNVSKDVEARIDLQSV